VTYLINSETKQKYLKTCFCLTVDESNDRSDTDQLLIVIRGITKPFLGWSKVCMAQQHGKICFCVCVCVCVCVKP
jgi:hypothetical protein